ncbi:hypothetical protein AgCh_005534 [Apium graveolens]
MNIKLATAESMTHDVLRDLLGLKSDMTGYTDNQQVQNITEKAQLHDVGFQNMDLEVYNLKKHLTEFVVERKGWLEEIDRKQAELVTTQIALEELRQEDRLLTTKNDMLMMEKVNQKKKILALLTILVDSLSCQFRNSSQPFSNTAAMDVLGSSDGTVHIWEIDTGRCLKIWELEEAVNYVAWNPSPELPILAVVV